MYADDGTAGYGLTANAAGVMELPARRRSLPAACFGGRHGFGEGDDDLQQLQMFQPDTVELSPWKTGGTSWMGSPRATTTPAGAAASGPFCCQNTVAMDDSILCGCISSGILLGSPPFASPLVEYLPVAPASPTRPTLDGEGLLTTDTAGDAPSPIAFHWRSCADGMAVALPMLMTGLSPPSTSKVVGRGLLAAAGASAPVLGYSASSSRPPAAGATSTSSVESSSGMMIGCGRAADTPLNPR
ncbi:hypothetical protein CHLRE_16g669127v5 [Chlamydomonas reinhardtii]|uniref:Uncharacterized protein n=1 Tax=Chlamydomonas reinhardtii TaxID=3055 RepID=A0A2K3CUD2_CHLRE|nr:uncharacterized protein CHLRE_16g669127v5 [Chlamydomonas reinhardtii]PNW71885.1 hypothetical protein CHLRE_16g669127v5 [Chlamydomonas reinhardtii]